MVRDSSAGLLTASATSRASTRRGWETGSETKERFSEAVEEITGRKVVAFMSQVHFAPDLAAEIFVLEPVEADAEPGGSEDGSAAQAD